MYVHPRLLGSLRSPPKYTIKRSVPPNNAFSEKHVLGLWSPIYYDRYHPSNDSLLPNSEIKPSVEHHWSGGILRRQTTAGDREQVNNVKYSACWCKTRRQVAELTVFKRARLGFYSPTLHKEVMHLCERLRPGGNRLPVMRLEENHRTNRWTVTYWIRSLQGCGCSSL